MLEEFRTGCVDDRHEVVPEVLFGGIEHVARGSLLSLGFAHGLTLSCLICLGDCAARSRGNRPLCLAVVRQYMMGSESGVTHVLRICILEAVGRFIRLVPLRRLLRLHGVSFDQTSSLGRLRGTLRTYVDHLKRELEQQRPSVSRLDWPSLICKNYYVCIT